MADDKLGLDSPMCRACLKLGPENKIFTTHKQTSLQYSYMFAMCSSIQVDPEDALPKLICRKCVNKLVNFYKFKCTITENDLKLREILKCKANGNNTTKASETDSNIGKTCLAKNEDSFKLKIEIKDEKDSEVGNRLEFDDDSNDSFNDCIKNEETLSADLNSKKITHQCDICGKILSCKSNLNQHLRKHTGERPHACELCGKTFFKAEHAVIHNRTHTGEKPHHCTLCPKKFNQDAALKVHMRTHSGERPHMCSVCGKSFSQSSSLIYHIRIHSGETPYTCKVCGKGFKNAGNLGIHKRFHENERRFQCKICERRFVTSSHLNVHLKQHNGDKSHKCMVCGKGFVRSEHLKGHLIIHTGQKPYSCKLCPKKYTQNSHLNRHLKLHTLT